MSEQRYRDNMPPTFPPVRNMAYFVESKFPPEPRDRNAVVELRTSPDDPEPFASRLIYVPAGYERSTTSFPFEELRNAHLDDSDYEHLVVDFVWVPGR